MLPSLNPHLRVGLSLDNCLRLAFLPKSLHVLLLHPSLHASLKMNAASLSFLVFFTDMVKKHENSMIIGADA